MYCVGDKNGCMIKSFVKYKQNVLLNQTYLCCTKAKYLNQCITLMKTKMLLQFDPPILKCKGEIRARASVADIPLHGIVVLNN